MKLLWDLVYLIYIVPLWLCAVYFTIVRLEDIGREPEDRSYSPDKFPYWKVMLLCLIPGLNWLFAGVITYKTFKSAWEMIFRR